MSAGFDMAKLKKQKDDIPDDYKDVGSYAKGKQNPTDPHMYRKTSHMPSDLGVDAYHNYIMDVAHKMAENPYLPRIYNITIRTDKNGDSRPSYDMEKLHDPKSVDMDSIIAMGDRMFKRFDPPDGELMHDSDDVMEYISAHIDEAFDSGDYRNIKDKSLIDAIDLIRDVKKKGKFYGDMHPGNFLIRITSKGPQLVLIDPLHDSGKSVKGARWG